MYSVQPSFSKCRVTRFCLSSNVAGTASSVYDTRTSIRSRRVHLHEDYSGDQCLTAHNDVSPFDFGLTSGLFNSTGTGHLDLASSTSEYLCRRGGRVFVMHMGSLTFPLGWDRGRLWCGVAGGRYGSCRRTCQWAGRLNVQSLRLKKSE